MTDLVELDSLEILVIIDNELDPISPCPSTAVEYGGGMRDVCARAPIPPSDVRSGSSSHEIRMDNICCSAHGLSLMITGTKDGRSHTILFDAGPEEDVWERNAKRLRADVGKIEAIQLSHWHCDHSGGLPKAIEMVNAARVERGYTALPPVQVDLHPDRPVYRGVRPPGMPVVSLQPDPTFEDLTSKNAVLVKSDQAHAVLDNMFLISGEIPRHTAYEVGFKFAVRFDTGTQTWTPDEKLMDERLLMCKVKDKGVVVFTGCSHAGVVNASTCALSHGGGAPLHAVVGGFHLADAQPELIQSTVADLQALDPKVLIAGHCTGWRAKFELQKLMPGRFVPSFVGSRFVI